MYLLFAADSADVSACVRTTVHTAVQATLSHPTPAQLPELTPIGLLDARKSSLLGKTDVTSVRQNGDPQTCLT